MNERLKSLRKSLGLTQSEFAERIGSVQNTITGYETGRRVPSSQVLALIAREFNVNETWLRTGEGEMFVPVSRDEQIASFMGELLHEESSFKYRFISMLSRLGENEWAVLEQKAKELVSGHEGDR